MLFQGKERPLFDAWMSDYNIIQSFQARSTLNYRSLEFTTLIKSSIEQNSRPFGWRKRKELEINLSHAFVMDSKVRFEKGVHYSTFDIHFKPAIFEILMTMMPELVYSFLNDYYAGREVSLFKKDTYPNQAILNIVRSMIGYVTQGGVFDALLDASGLLLIAHIFLWKAEIAQRRGLSTSQAETVINLNRIKEFLSAEEEVFRGIKYYAQLAQMSPTKFKNSFRKETGTSPFQYWQDEQLQKVVIRLLTTEDLIKDIALETGFGDTQALDKAFRKKFEESPTDYKKRMNL